VSESLGDRLPPSLRAALDEAAPGFTLVLVSVGTGGWPHLALLSVGEVLALDDRTLRLALWPASTATANLAREPRVTLAAVLDGVSLSVRLTARPAGTLELPSGELAVFDATVAEVRADVAPYAVLESGIRFRLTEPAETLRRWAATRSALRRLGLPGDGAHAGAP
jgi:hypothetical protein